MHNSLPRGLFENVTDVIRDAARKSQDHRLLPENIRSATAFRKASQFIREQRLPMARLWRDRVL